MGSQPPNWRNQPPFDDEDENYPPTQGGTYPPAQNYPPTGQTGANYPPINLDDPRGGNYPPQGAGGYPPQGNYPPQQPPQGANYPPQGNYPPAGANYPPQGAGGYPPPPTGNINLDDPQYGGQPAGYPPQGTGGYPPQGNYPPQQPPQAAGYPPQGNYPPAGANYPPQGTGGYPPPQTGNINLDAPQYGGQPAGNVPQGTGGYPPAQPQSSSYAQQAGPIDLGDPLQGSSRRGTASRQEFVGDAPISLDDPRFGGRSTQRDEPSFESRASQREKTKRNDDAPQQKPTFLGLTERQIESLSWGSAVILLGVSLMMSVTGNARFLTLIFPLVAGVIIMSSALIQKVVMGWPVSRWTWLTAILLISYTITLQLSGDGTNIFKWIAYFLGTLTVMTGLTLFLQVFRKQSNHK